MINIDDPRFFREDGPCTVRTQEIRKLANELKNPDKSIPRIVSEYLRTLRYDDSNKDSLFRKRTASEIIEDSNKFVTGCTDVALVCLALMREYGIPARYVETFKESAVEQGKWNSGHIFVDLFVNGGWQKYEPLRGNVSEYNLKENKYLEAGKGLDFWEIYLKENGVYRQIPVNLQTFEPLRNFKIDRI